jgi:hypothetical protein
MDGPGETTSSRVTGNKDGIGADGNGNGNGEEDDKGTGEGKSCEQAG